jgi:hypothetical protein
VSVELPQAGHSGLRFAIVGLNSLLQTRLNRAQHFTRMGRPCVFALTPAATNLRERRFGRVLTTEGPAPHVDRVFDLSM